MKTKTGENRCHKQVAAESLHRLLEHVDSELAQAERQHGCLHCGGRLHRSNYERKPRGGPPQWDERESFCCDQDDFRRRCTPPSVRFLGRKVYVGFVFVLMSAMQHGLSAQRVAQLCEVLPLDRRTLERWRQWWLQTFVNSQFWKAARARFMPLLGEWLMPLSLCERFKVEGPEQLLALLKFLAPITTVSGAERHAM